MQRTDNVVYTFSYTDNDSPELDGYPLQTQTVKTSVFESCTTWDAVLKDFIRFLEGIYGYNISENVEIHSFMSRFVEDYKKDEDHDHPLSDT
jgi:hypothetical protein